MDTSAWARFLLLNVVILPFRPRQSAEAYHTVWDDHGSPLLRHSRDFVKELALTLGERFAVRVAMRYGNPSIAEAIAEFRRLGIDRILAFPLFPQYASSTSGTALEEVFRVAGSQWNVPAVSVVPPFFDDPGMLRAFAEVGTPVLGDLRPDHVLFSFHGLPERQVRKSDDSGRHCLASQTCCSAMVSENRNCYRAQCYRTAEGIAAALGLPQGGFTVSFQSRLGRTPWVRPYTDETVRALARGGTRRLAVFCPAFVADCLETLEEIGVRAREDFVANGGEELRLVPSLNAHPAWIEAAARLVRAAAWSETAVSVP